MRKSFFIFPALIAAFLLGMIITSGYWIVPIAWGTCTFLPETNGCDSNPPWGPFLDNPKAQFYIRKIDTYYVAEYQYRGRQKNVLIEKSAVDLAPFVNKRVRISGHFYETHDEAIKEQCIVDICSPVPPAEKSSFDKYYTITVPQIVEE